MTTKNLVLEELNKNTPVSGEDLAKKCNVSRAAIWKAVNSLRDEGYAIKGTTNGGYILEAEQDVFSEEVFRIHLMQNYPEYKDIHIECIKEIDSTNNYAKRLLSECGPLRNTAGQLTVDGKKYHQSAFLAEAQTEGKGRLGRQFVSSPKCGIYLTLIYAPEGGITQPAKLTALSAVAACRAIEKLYGKQVQIKWINDLFYNHKKISGILTEGFTNFETGIIEAAVIGIGINLTENKLLPEEIKKIAGSLFAPGEGNPSRCKLAAEITAQCFNIFKENPEKAFAEYKKLSFIIGKQITVYPLIGDDKTAYQAKAVDIDSNAALIVQKENGELVSLNSGEVSLKSANMI